MRCFPQVRSLVVVVSNYGGAGFQPLRHAGAKLWDISAGEEGARPLAEWHHLSKHEQEADVSQVAMIKVRPGLCLIITVWGCVFV